MFRLRPRRTKKKGAEIVWFGISERGFQLKTTLHRGLKVNGKQPRFSILSIPILLSGLYEELGRVGDKPIPILVSGLCEELGWVAILCQGFINS